jgi:hypothetical protein
VSVRLFRALSRRRRLTQALGRPIEDQEQSRRKASWPAVLARGRLSLQRLVLRQSLSRCSRIIGLGSSASAPRPTCVLLQAVLAAALVFPSWRSSCVAGRPRRPHRSRPAGSACKGCFISRVGRRWGSASLHRVACGHRGLTMRSSGPARSKLLARSHIPAAQAA